MRIVDSSDRPAVGRLGGGQAVRLTWEIVDSSDRPAVGRRAARTEDIVEVLLDEIVP